MKNSIQLQWIKENRLHQKILDEETIEEIFKETEEKVGNISEIECIYINFDRNKKKRENKIWIRNLLGDDKKILDTEIVKIVELYIGQYCK